MTEKADGTGIHLMWQLHRPFISLFISFIGLSLVPLRYSIKLFLVLAIPEFSNSFA